MGCCASSEEEPPVDEGNFEGVDKQNEDEAGETELTTNKVGLQIEEAEAQKTKPGDATFISSVLKARAEAGEDAAVMLDCCKRLQAHNRRLKEYVAIYDCETVNEAMNGGFLGMGCNDAKLIACLLTRTKSQLQLSKKKYRDLYDKDLRAEVEGETGGAYRKLMHFALASPEQYIADIIDKACVGMGCDEVALLEVFVTHTQAELQAGKDKWEGRTDNHLVDYLKGQLGSSYRHLNRLLNLLFMGDREEGAEADEEKAAEQIGQLHEECEKGWFEDFDESLIIEIIGANSTAQNALCAQLYEKEYSESLAHALKGKCGDKLFYCLNGLLLTKPNFLAMRLHDAMKGWFNDKDILTRLLGGLDGDKMSGVLAAYEDKYDQPLWSALKENLGESSDFIKAAQTWIRALEDPCRGAEKFTELEADELEGDAEKLCEMLDWLLLEHEGLHVFVAHLDVETIREATKGKGTDDTPLIRCFATRNKRCLARINIGYRNAYGEPLQRLLDGELGGDEASEWYLYLAKFLVVQAEQADAMILDLAMDGEEGTVDHEALVEFICARHPKRVRAAKQRWEASHDDSVVDLLADNLSGDMSRLALRMLKGKRDLEEKTTVDTKLATQQAHKLNDGEVDFIEVLCDNSPSQNKELARIYEEAYDQSLKRAISQEFSGPVKSALLALMMGPADWYAMQLKSALSGDEVNDKQVCRIVGAHDKDEIKAIAAAYDKKYGVTLKSAISSSCEGNYKRLAVAWVDLKDQLAQPEKKVEFNKEDAAPEAADETKATGSAVDDEISDEDDSPPSDHDPASPMFKAKLANWERKFAKYKEMGKERKAEHYQKLLLLYPPMPKGHKLLKGYHAALSEEYSKDASGEDWTTIWFDALTDDDFDVDGDGELDGTDKEAFKKWMDVTESMIVEKRASLKEMKAHWGLNEKREKRESVVEECAALEDIPVATPAGIPVATPAQPAYMGNYPPQQQMGMMPGMFNPQMMMGNAMMQQQQMMQQQMMMQQQQMMQMGMQMPGGGANVSVNVQFGGQ
jgi:hypothetical protein